jgi:hypothetical protein
VPVRSVKDITDAYAAGRVHTQRFFKNGGTSTGDGQWHDWSYASGQPAFDARIGAAGEFNPYVAQRNDAIYFPPISAGQERHLQGMTIHTIAGGNDQTQVEVAVHDLLGVYPLIDGDSTDVQAFDNSQTLPRYADGVGVFPVIVNHVAPGLTSCQADVVYTNSDGVQKTVQWRVYVTGLNKVNYAVASGGIGGFLYSSMQDADKGVRSIDSITFLTPPGGLFAIYLVKHLATTSTRGGLTGVSQTVATEKCFCLNSAYSMPRIYDGAWLGMFYMPTGGTRTTALFGDFTFIWN